MNSEHLTDRMPDVRHARDAWTAGDHQHLAACVECAAEWRVVSIVRNADALTAADADVIAESVLDRLRTSNDVIPLRRHSTWRRALVGLAAAASIAVAFLAWPEASTEEQAFVPSREATMLPELDELLDAELEVVLATVQDEAVDPFGTVPTFSELTDDELEQLLEEVEG